MTIESRNSRHSVLIVDDDSLSREVLSVLLESEGYLTRTASHGEDALKLLAALSVEGHLPQTILADLQMPGLAGNPLAERFRALYGPSLHLIVMSASQPEPALVTGYDRFLRKPICLRSFAETLEGLGDAKTTEGTGMSRASHEVLDETVYATLAAAMSPQQMLDVYRFFVADVQQRVKRMRVALEPQDEVQFRKEAHTLQGGCGMLGAAEMRALAASLEASGFSDRTRVELDTLLDDLATASERLRSMLEARWRLDV